MRKAGFVVAIAALAVAAACSRQEQATPTPPPPAPGTPEWKIENAMSAAPEFVVSAARVMDWPATDTGQLVELRAGSNGWTCFPDGPATPANDPACADDQAMLAMQAMRTRSAPRIEGMAVWYFLQGSQVASTTDPFKMRPDSGQAWIDVGPFICASLPSRSAYRGLPTAPSATAPWVVWGTTPYGCIVMPAARPAVRTPPDTGVAR